MRPRNNFFDPDAELRLLKAKAQKTGYWNQPNVPDEIQFAVQMQNAERLQFLHAFFDNELAAQGKTIEPFDPAPDPGEADHGEIFWGTTGA